MPDVVLVKLGGSLLTDKRGEGVARRGVIERLAGEIATALPTMAGPRSAERLILGHGSGSFGHVAAARAGLGRGPYDGKVDGIADTQDQAARLHRLVVGALVAAGVPAFTWAPSSALTATAGKPAAGGAVEPLLAALDRALVPVTYGDVVIDRRWGAVIFSTETVLHYLIGRLRRRGHAVRRLLWLGETAGVYDREGRTIPRIDAASYRRVLKLVDAPAGTDVTGGMLLRLETARALARLGIESWIFDGTVPGLLAAALAGDPVPGTRFVVDAPPIHAGPSMIE